jgi:hypothetical protein
MKVERICTLNCTPLKMHLHPHHHVVIRKREKWKDAIAIFDVFTPPFGNPETENAL